MNEEKSNKETHQAMIQNINKGKIVEIVVQETLTMIFDTYINTRSFQVKTTYKDLIHSFTYFSNFALKTI